MALSIIQRPQGFVLDTTQNSAPATDGGAAGVLFTYILHGLNTGDYVYIYSAIADYNGYWYVDKQDANIFRIRRYATASNQLFINTTTAIFYKSVLTQNWSCVHLPVIYKLLSSIWPTNGVDSVRSITNFSNWNGYTYIVASGDIKTTGTASSLEQIIISGTTVDGLDGVYQIIQWFSETNFVINLAYSEANFILVAIGSYGSIQYHYYNYCAKIRVYAGIAAAHYWTAQKAYELIVELKLIPDSTGIITVNIAEYIKKQIEVISNNSILGTLPNNIDAWCNFYITYAESYDDSNMYTVSEYTSSYTNDSGTFEGYAVNAKLPFKTRSAGAMSQYISGLTSTTRQKWLTGFSRPMLFAGKYFDISYIKNSSSSGDYIKRDTYRNIAGNYSLIASVLDAQTDYDQGIYRYAITQSGALEDRIDITYYNSGGIQLSETLTIDVNSQCSFQDFYLVWLNNLGGYDYWNFLARKTYSVNITESKTQDVNLLSNYPDSYGEFADSIIKQTIRRSRNAIKITSQFLTIAQQDSIKLMLSSPLVQICTSQYDRETLIVDPSSLSVRKDQDKIRKLSFSMLYTDEIPTQKL